ncbi:metallophosphatase domain-containing protein [Aspergillus stella-maris]|uniref:metallophosphatase domain-containing protein n=1 Tax=Aspergillus stella-maris TaxID=1810926 RepID=UPI003CCD163A
MTRRKTRFVCVSDTHAYTPSEAGFKLPKGDVLIHAGDLTNRGTKSELKKTMDWIAAAEFEVKIVICGNHDITLDIPFYNARSSNFHRPNPEDPSECLKAITEASPSVLFLKHESALVRLQSPTGPGTIFKVFGSPYSRHNGNWAFLYEPDEAENYWNDIPLDADIVVTHGPPRTESVCGGEGCEALKRRLGLVRPCLSVFGHVHEGRGFERVMWGDADGKAGNIPVEAVFGCHCQGSEIESVVRGTLPPQGSKKQSLIDLTGKRSPRLDNDGMHRRSARLFAESPSTSSLTSTFRTANDAIVFPSQRKGHDEAVDKDKAQGQAPTVPRTSSTRSDYELEVNSKFDPEPRSLLQGSKPEPAPRQTYPEPQPRSEAEPQTQTQTQTQSQMEDSVQRRETCLVNAAIAATNWPHPGGRRFHPGPIVVDLELPVWNEDG